MDSNHRSRKTPGLQPGAIAAMRPQHIGANPWYCATFPGFSGRCITFMLERLVWIVGFEPTVSRPQTARDGQLHYIQILARLVGNAPTQNRFGICLATLAQPYKLLKKNRLDCSWR